MAGNRRRLHGEELCNLYTLSKTVRVIKSVMRWSGHVECMEGMRNVYKILVRYAEGNKHLEDYIQMDVRIYLMEKRWE